MARDGTSGAAMSSNRVGLLVGALGAAALLWSMGSDRAARPSPRPVPTPSVAEAEPGRDESPLAPRSPGAASVDRRASGSSISARGARVPSPPAPLPAASTNAASSGDGGASDARASADAGAEGPDRAAPVSEFPPRAAFDGFVPSEVQPLDVERTEATVADIHACIEAGGCSPTDFGRGPGCTVGTERLSHPANCVTHVGARAYCRWIGARLPTVREWLQEATDGGQRRWPWGDEGMSCARAVLRHGCGESALLPVCSRPLGNSRTGVCDLIGNVAEWTRTVRDGEARVMGEEVSRLLGFPLWSPVGEARPGVGVRCVRDNAARTGP